MASKPTQPHGQCFLCGRVLPKDDLTSHIRTHLRERPGDADLIWIRVTDQTPWAVLPSEAFWLDLEVPARLDLEELDDYLRAIWVECCGHLSHFVVREGKKRLFFEREMEPKAPAIPPDQIWKSTFQGMAELPMAGVTVGEIADRVDTFEYEYDYGTTTLLRLQVMARYQGPRPNPKAPIRLLSRNLKPFVPCAVCGREAAYLDVFEGNQPLCEEHAAEREEGLLPLVNSPRTGLCGYDGPFDESLRFEKVDLPR